MAAGDVAGDREPEPAVALVLIARVVEPVERPEHVVALRSGMPGPSSSTSMRSHCPSGAARMMTCSPKRAALVTRLVMARLKACRFSGSTSSPLALAHLQLDRRAVVPRLLHLLQQLADIGRRRLLAAVALGEGQIVLEHVLHLVDVG